MLRKAIKILIHVEIVLIILERFLTIFIILCHFMGMQKIMIKSFVKRGRKFFVLAVSKLASFTDSDSRDRSFSPA